MIDIGVICSVGEIAIKLIQKVKDNRKFRNTFINIGRDITIVQDESAGEILEQLNIMFSEGNMTQLAEKCENISGYQFMDTVRSELDKIFEMESYGAEERKKKIDLFMKWLKDAIFENNKNLYRDIFDSEWRKEDAKSHAEMDNKLSLILKRLEQYSSESLYNKEQWLIDNTKYNVNFELFDFGDEKNENEIIEAIQNNPNTYIQGRSREESLYYLLHVIKNHSIEMANKVAIINSPSDWKKLKNNASDLILIPYFFADEIDVVPNNKCIFIYSLDDIDPHKQIIKVPNRTLSNLIRKLELFVPDTDEAYRLGKDTHNIFASLKRRIFKGKYSKPAWVDNVNSSLIPALLLGKWEENEGDKLLIEKLSGVSYATYVAKVKRFINGSDPFLKRIVLKFGDGYAVVDLDEAWEYLKDFITENELNAFATVVKDTLSYVDKIHDYPPEKQFNAPWQDQELMYSASVKEGMVRSIYFIDRLCNHDSWGKRVIGELLDNITSEKQWFAVAGIFPELMDVEPDATLNRMEKELKETTPELLKIFRQPEGNVLTDRHYYIYYLTALEHCLFRKECAARSIRVLEKLNDYNAACKLVNTPNRILCSFFCAWYHETAVEVEDKERLLEEYVSTGSEKAWKVLVEVLPIHGIGGTYSPMSKPLFEAVDSTNKAVYVKTVNATNKAYFEIAIKYAGNNLGRWSDLFSTCTFVFYGFKNIVFDKVSQVLKETSSDEEKFKFSQVVRNFLYMQRYIPKNSRFNEDGVKEIEEKIFNAIKYEDGIYDYLYAFNNIRMHEIHPLVIDDDDYSQNIERWEKIRAEILKNKTFDVIFNNEEKLDGFLAKCSDYAFVGSAIAEGRVQKYDDNLVMHFWNMGKKQTLYGYLGEILKAATEQDIENVLGSNQVVNNLELTKIVLECCNNDQAVINILNKINAQRMEYFWSHTSRYRWDDNKDVYNHVAQKLVQYKNFVPVLILAKAKHTFSLDLYLSILEGIGNDGNSKEYDSWDIQSVFKKIYKFIDVQDKDVSRIAQLEVIFIRCFDDEKPRYLSKEFRFNPGFIVEMIEKSFKKSDELEYQPTDEEKTIAANCYEVLNRLKVCPCLEDDGETINYELLRQWVEAYLNAVIANKQKNIGEEILGQLLSRAPIDEDGIYPHSSVRRIIEENYSENLCRGFYVEVYNSRGAHYCNNGYGEKELADKYNNYGDVLCVTYPHTASILRRIAQSYERESRHERECAENGL